MVAEMDIKSHVEAELRQMKDHCQRGGVAEEVQKIREQVTQGNLSLAGVGTTEEELQQCLKSGYQNSAKNWLRVAREKHDIGVAIANIRERVQEGNITLADIGTSEKELNDLLSPTKRNKSRRPGLFGHHAN